MERLVSKFMMKTGVVAVLSAGVLLALPSAAGAAVVAGYDFNAGTGAPTASGEDVTVGDFTAGPGLSTITYADGKVATSDAETNGDSGTSGLGNLATSNTVGDYFSFTVTPDAGATLTLTTLTFNYMELASQTPTGFEVYFQVRSSLDGYANPIRFNNNSRVATTGSPTGGTATIDFTDPTVTDYFDTQFAAVSGPITFRIVVADKAAAANDIPSGNVIDNVVLSGSAIPEPASAGLMAAGAWVALWRRRR